MSSRSRSRSYSRGRSASRSETPDMADLVEKEVYRSESIEKSASREPSPGDREEKRGSGSGSRDREASPKQRRRSADAKRKSRSRSRGSSRGRRSGSRERRRKTRSPSPAEMGHRIHLADIGTRPDKYTIEKEFSRFGKILEVWVAENPPCFAFVVYKEREDAEDAMEEMNGATLFGQRIRVSWAKPRTKGGRRARESFGNDMRCYTCGRFGHLARNCFDGRARGSYSRPYGGGGGGGGGPVGYRYTGWGRNARSRSRDRDRRRSRSPRRSISPRRRRSRSRSMSH